jgi:hypothetical protein
MATTEFPTTLEYTITTDPPAVTAIVSGDMAADITPPEFVGEGFFFEFWGEVDAALPIATLSSTFHKGWSADIQLPKLAIIANWARGMSLNAVLPKVTMVSAFGVENSWSLAVELPVIQIGGAFYAYDATSHTAFCLNPVNNAHTDYTDYALTSFCRLNGVYLGTASDGIHSLGGDTDGVNEDQIDASARFGVVDEGESRLRRADSAYLNLRHNGDINVTMDYDESERDISLIDFDFHVDGDGLHTRRAKFSRAGEGRNLQLGLENVSGSDFEITDVEVVTVTLSRR